MRAAAIFINFLLRAADAQEFITHTVFTDAACTANARVIGYTAASCAGWRASGDTCSSANGNASGLYMKATCTVGSIPTPTAGVWQTGYTSSSCAPSSLSYYYEQLPGECRVGFGIGGGGSKVVCTTGGGAQFLTYTNADCSGDIFRVEQAEAVLNTTLGTCARDRWSSTTSVISSCYGALLAPLALPSLKTCAGSTATLPSLPVSSAGLECFTGDVNLTSTLGSYVYPMTAAGFQLCVAFTLSINGNSVRAYSGASSLDFLRSFVSLTNLFVCNTSKCNSPAMDACATAALASPVCGGAPANGTLPPSAAAPIACFSNLNSSTAPALQTTPASGLCVAFTHRCQGASDPIPNCGGKAAGFVVRIYSDATAAAGALRVDPATSQTMAGHFYSGGLATSVYRSTYLDALFICNTAGW